MPMSPAPALDCIHCGRTIAKSAGHYLLTGGRLVCSRCLETRTLHGTLFPDCPQRWHDLYDHMECSASRAGAAHLLGLWP